MNDTAAAEDKVAIRTLARHRRDALGSPARAAASTAIAAKLAAMSLPSPIFVYVSTGSEVDTHGLIDRFTSAGASVLVPRLADRVTMEAVPFPGWSSMRPGALGILTPPSGPPASAAGTVVVPGLAFDARGYRIGYGAGYYDRWLASHPAETIVGIAFEAQVFPRVPRETHDLPLPQLITEARTINNLYRERR